jgi:hypothetical protein
MDDEQLKFPEDYVSAMEAGPMNPTFMIALGELTTDQRAHLALILEDRRTRRQAI